MINKIKKHFQPFKFDTSISEGFSSFDFSESMDGFGKNKGKLFLRRFSADDLLKIMDKVGLLSHLRKKGFNDPIPVIEIDDARINYLKLYNKKEEPDSLLIDLRLSETKFIPPKKFFDDEKDVVTYDMVVIEWLSSQNPAGQFDKSKPQLPGQKKPGLGVLNFCFEMMYIVARDVLKDGFLDVPDHAHGAIMYSKKFQFFDPRHEGILRAILRDLKGYSIYDISWGAITETIIDTYKQKPHKYDPSEQIFYTSDRMKNYFKSSKYKKEYKKYYKIKKFVLDYDEMIKRREKILATKNIVDL